MKVNDWVVVTRGSPIISCNSGTIGKVLDFFEDGETTWIVIKIIRHVGDKFYLERSGGLFRIPKVHLKVIFSRTVHKEESK